MAQRSRPHRPPARPARTALSLVVAAALAGTLAACHDSAATAAGSHPASAPPAASSTPSPAADPTLHVVSNGGHKLAFHVTPGRGPTIVLDAGGGADSSYWKNFVPTLAKKTGAQIITYDRAGMGDSDEVPGPWNVDNAVSDLAAGLNALGATHDIVLVSHSEAGEIATYFVRSHPHQVAGAVLVDASLPEFYTDNEIARIVAATKDQIGALASQPPTKQNRQLLSVAQSFVPTHQAYHNVSWPKDVPATAIVSQKTPFEASPQDAQAWRDAQAAFVSEAPNRRLIVAANSSHDIPLDQPEVILNAINDMLEKAR